MLPAHPEIAERVDFAVKVSFERGVGDPTRPFKTIVGLIDALGGLDRDLVKSVEVKIEPVLFLEDVESSSIKVWLATVLRIADDASLKSGDWKKVLGAYLVKAKYVLLGKLDGQTSIAEPGLLEAIQKDLLVEAEKTDLRGLPGYTPISRSALAAHIASITLSMASLQPGDSVTYESLEGAPVNLNRGLRVDSEEMTLMLTSRVIKNKDTMILKVKKPDFLGSSMWEFKYEGRTIEARIQAEDWLTRFKQDGSGVVPGSALRAIVEVEVAYDDENEALPAKYTILEVLEVLPPPGLRVQLLIDDGTPPSGRRIRDEV